MMEYIDSGDLCRCIYSRANLLEELINLDRLHEAIEQLDKLQEDTNKLRETLENAKD